ncbi:hypothetical protein DFH08DRAFT_28158 [Mycena albidolilacea]|uniref:Uncharacterized protein n=1 Tax=Mycena albidolilacea TaxID=1033008 RepID=A0AAD7AVF3_9AGAR|nr:hypothetical protein DFH08DRAFT_28158 [Mycena albidolilacea]
MSFVVKGNERGVVAMRIGNHPISLWIRHYLSIIERTNAHRHIAHRSSFIVHRSCPRPPPRRIGHPAQCFSSEIILPMLSGFFPAPPSLSLPPPRTALLLRSWMTACPPAEVGLLPDPPSLPLSSLGRDCSGASSMRAFGLCSAPTCPCGACTTFPFPPWLALVCGFAPTLTPTLLGTGACRCGTGGFVTLRRPGPLSEFTSILG